DEQKGFGNTPMGDQALQVFEKRVRALQDPKKAKERQNALTSLQKGAEAASRPNALRALLNSMHLNVILPASIAEQIGAEDAPGIFELGIRKDQVTRLYAQYLDSYEQMRTNLKDIESHIRQMAQKS